MSANESRTGILCAHVHTNTTHKNTKVVSSHFVASCTWGTFLIHVCTTNPSFYFNSLLCMSEKIIFKYFIYIYICIYMWPHIIFFKKILYIYIYLSYFIFMFIRHLILVLLQLYITRIYYYFYLNAYFYKIFSFLKMCVST